MKSIRLADAIVPEHIYLDLDTVDRIELIREVAKRLGDNAHVRDTERLAHDAITREEELSTGIDRGIAMPHARSDAVDTLTCAFVRPVKPVDFGSADGRPCDLIFFSAVPRACVDQYLHFTAAVVRKLHHENVLTALREAKTPAAVQAALGLS